MEHLSPTTHETPYATTTNTSLWEPLLALLPQLPTFPSAQEAIHHALQQHPSLSHSLGLPPPDIARILSQPDENWVFLYEHYREKHEKHLRRQGQPQTGVFYTPPAIAQYLTARSLGQYLTHIFQEIQSHVAAQNLEAAQQRLHHVQQLRIIDPACGTGVFLVMALQELQQFFQHCQQEFSTWASVPATACFTPLYGIDLDPLHCRITQLRLAQHCFRHTAEADPFQAISRIEALLARPSAFICGDTLQLTGSNPPLHPPIYPPASFHFILGNPPYVSEVRRQAARFQSLQQNSSSYYQSKMDLCDAFIAWSLDYLTPGGQLAFVLPEYWMQRSSLATLRTRLWRDGFLQEFWTFPQASLFKNAPGHHTSLIHWQKQTQPTPLDTTTLHQPRAVLYGATAHPQQLQPQQLTTQWLQLDPSSHKILVGNTDEITILAQLNTGAPLLKPHEIQQGLVMPQGRFRKRKPLASQAQPEPGGLFLLTETELAQLQLSAAEREMLKPYYLPGDFQAFQGFASSQPTYQLIYGNRENRLAITQNPVIYARLQAHFQHFQSLNTSAFAPYGLHRPRQADWFEDAQKILCPRQVFEPTFAIVPFPAYVNENFYILRTAHPAHYCCALLNSDVAWLWFYKQKRKGHRLQLDKDVLSLFPQPTRITPTQQQHLQDLSAQLARSQTPQNPMYQDRLAMLNRIVAQAYGLSPEQHQLIQTQRSTILTS